MTFTSPVIIYQILYTAKWAVSPVDTRSPRAMQASFFDQENNNKSKVSRVGIKPFMWQPLSYAATHIHACIHVLKHTYVHNTHMHSCTLCVCTQQTQRQMIHCFADFLFRWPHKNRYTTRIAAKLIRRVGNTLSR